MNGPAKVYDLRPPCRPPPSQRIRILIYNLVSKGRSRVGQTKYLLLLSSLAQTWIKFKSGN